MQETEKEKGRGEDEVYEETLSFSLLQMTLDSSLVSKRIQSLNIHLVDLVRKKQALWNKPEI